MNGNFQYWLTDALGTVRDILDGFGNVIRSQEFDEHGKLVSESGSGTFAPKTYQGGLSVNDDRNDSGLYLMGHRHYAPELGRFISRDPIGFAGELNLLNGAGTSPVNYVDPSGLDIRVLATVPYLNPRAGGPIYVQKWTSYPTFEAFATAMEHAPNGSVQEIIIEGHSQGCKDPKHHLPRRRRRIDMSPVPR